MNARHLRILSKNSPILIRGVLPLAHSFECLGIELVNFWRAWRRVEQLVGRTHRKVRINVRRKVKHRRVMGKGAIQPHKKGSSALGIVQSHAALYAGDAYLPLQVGVMDVPESAAQLWKRFFTMTGICEVRGFTRSSFDIDGLGNRSRRWKNSEDDDSRYKSSSHELLG